MALISFCVFSEYSVEQCVSLLAMKVINEQG